MTHPQVYAAIVGVMEDIGKEGISKARKNEQQGYKFRGIDDVYNELNRLLAKHRLLMLPTVVKDEQTERQTPRGGTLFFTRLTVDFKLVCADDGSSEIVRTIGEAMDSGDKSTNKAQSAAYKYAAMQVFCIPTEGDNDADAKTHEVTPKFTQTQQPKQTLAERYEAFAARLKAANSTPALERVWSLGAGLLADLDKADEALAADLREIHETRLTALNAREAA